MGIVCIGCSAKDIIGAGSEDPEQYAQVLETVHTEPVAQTVEPFQSYASIRTGIVPRKRTVRTHNTTTLSPNRGLSTDRYCAKKKRRGHVKSLHVVLEDLTGEIASRRILYPSDGIPSVIYSR